MKLPTIISTSNFYPIPHMYALMRFKLISCDGYAKDVASRVLKPFGPLIPENLAIILTTNFNVLKALYEEDLAHLVIWVIMDLSFLPMLKSSSPTL